MPDDLAKKITKLIRDEFSKVKSQIQGDELRVTSKSRDDLQATMALLKDFEVADGGVALRVGVDLGVGVIDPVHPRPLEDGLCTDLEGPLRGARFDLQALPRVRVAVALGGFAYDHALRIYRGRGLPVPVPKPRFGHGREVDLGPDGPVVLLPPRWRAALTKISNANPQQRDYNWGTVELVRWSSTDGVPLAFRIAELFGLAIEQVFVSPTQHQSRGF